MTYQICVRCVMDTSDNEISFNDQGICSHCTNFDQNIRPNWEDNEVGFEKLKLKVEQIKKEGSKKKYDCIVGLSGGVDSSYLIYVAVKKLGLRPLAVHVDGGWNSDEAVSNIEKLTEKLGVDLFTDVVDWEEMRELQLAFLKAQVANQDIPQDHAFFAGLYNFAVKNNIRYVLSGSNHATESILPTSWGYDAMDLWQINDILNKFGTLKLKKFPTVGIFKLKIYYPLIKRMEVIKPLNYIKYDKAEAMRFLQEEFNWSYYGGKHHESRFTKFFQTFYLPTKFGFDKRRPHLSSLIVDNKISREEALLELKKSPYNESTIEEDFEYISKKLNITVDELKNIMSQPIKHYSDYKSQYHLKRKIKKWLGRI